MSSIANSIHMSETSNTQQPHLLIVMVSRQKHSTILKQRSSLTLEARNRCAIAFHFQHFWGGGGFADSACCWGDLKITNDSKRTIRGPKTCSSASQSSTAILCTSLHDARATQATHRQDHSVTEQSSCETRNA